MTEARHAQGDAIPATRVRELVHRLRGTAPTYGFVELGAFARRVEDALRAQPTADADAWARWQSELAGLARAPR
jgi:HPt (histidine-containing phosphotransfer) domain-containing protein